MSRPEKMTPYLRPENLKNLPYFAVHTYVAALPKLPLFFKSKMVAIRFANTKCSFAPRIPPALHVY